MASMPAPPVTAIVKLPDRERARERERRSRARRTANLERMRHMKDALERAEVVLRTMDDADAVWEGFLDDDAMRVRRFLRQWILLRNEVRELTHEREQMQRLLREHQLASSTIECMMGTPIVHDWEWHVQHWRGLTRRHYRHWTLEECNDEIAAGLREVLAFQWSTDKLTSGINFMGWREERRVDQLGGTFQCQFYKTFSGYEIMDYVNLGWDSYTNEAVHNEVIIGPQTQGTLEVLQQLRPNIMIIRRAERYSSIDIDAHAVRLVFRVQTKHGFTQCVRSIRCHELEREINGPRDVWPSNFVWMHWEHLEDKSENEKGYHVSIGGSMSGINVEYAHEWMFDALGSVLRGEQIVTRRKLITSD